MAIYFPADRVRKMNRWQLCELIAELTRRGATVRILVCGDRNWNDARLILKVLRELGNGHSVIHGDARGADILAARAAEKLGWKVKAYPADWNKYGRAAGPIRNKLMLEEGKPDLVLAFHDHIDSSKGTKNMVSIAKQANVQVIMVKHE